MRQYLKYAPLIFISLLILSCDDSAYLDGGISASKPTRLARIDDSILSVFVNVDNTDTNIQGFLDTNNTWQVVVNVVPGENYSVIVNWYAEYNGSDVLILEQFGTFYADPDSIVITMDLDFRTQGLPRFDLDCDQIINIDEIEAGTDPQGAPGCDGPVIIADDDPGVSETSLTDAEDSWSIADYSNVSEGLPSPGLTVEQPLVVRAYNSARSMTIGYGLVYGARSDNMSAIVELIRIGNGQKKLRFDLDPAMDAFESNLQGAECSPRSETKLSCTVPYDWQLNTWYLLRISDIPAAVNGPYWRASLVPQAGGEAVEIGTMVPLSAIPTWNLITVGMSYDEKHTVEDCRNGISPAAVINFSPYRVNGSVSANRISSSFASRCVRFGDWFLFDRVNSQNSELYSLTLGHVQ